MNLLMKELVTSKNCSRKILYAFIDRKTWKNYKHWIEITNHNSYYNNLEIEITIEIKHLK